MSERPRAHDDLVFERHERPEGPTWKVYDPTQGTVFWFNERAFDVLNALDGARTVDDVAAAVGARDPLARKSVLGLIQAFDRAGLLASARADRRAVARSHTRVADDRLFWGQLRAIPLAEVSEQVLAIDEGMTSDCGQCGLHCCTYAVDVQTGEIEALAAAAAALPVARERLFSATRPAGSTEPLPLTRVEPTGCCVLFDEGLGGCRVHASAGLEVKPVACQLYPTVLTVRPDGARLGARVGCAHPARTTEPMAVGRHREMLRRLVRLSPSSAVRRAPEEVQISEALRVPWAQYAAWERAAVAAVRAAPDAATGIVDAVTLALSTFALERPAENAIRARSLAGGLSTVVREQRASDAEADALVAVASEEAPMRPRPFPREAVVVALEALEPLRFATLISGLGVLRLAVAMGDRHARSAREPAEAAAAVFRALDQPNVNVTLARSGEAALGAVAVDPAF